MNAIRHQGTRIEFSIEDLGFQRQLAEYERSANVVRNEYDRWLSTLTGLASSSADDRSQGARLLFEITSLDTVNRISKAMRQMETSLLGRAPLRGVLDYLPGVLEAAVHDVERPPLVTICGRPFYDSFHVLTQFRPQYTAAIDHSLAPLFTSVLTDLHEGITLLELSALRIQRRQLTERYAGITAVCRYIAAFWTTQTQGPNLEAAMQRAFDAAVPATVDDELRRNAPWAEWNTMHLDPWTDGFPRHWRFPERLGAWHTVASRPENLARTPGPGGNRGPLVSLIRPGFRFGTSVEQIGLREHTSFRGRPWVSFGGVFDTGNTAYPVPTPGDLFGPGGAPPSLQVMTEGITRLELGTASA
jgi:hypothetical protein